MKYPKNLKEFERQFETEKQCRDYIFQLKFPDGFICPKCGHNEAWERGNGVYKCKHKKCRQEMSVLTGTIFQDSRTPLTTWFRAIWQVIAQKSGVSANGLQAVLGIGGYQTSWTILHKIRRAMVRPNREKLSGTVEVDEAYIGGSSKGKRGRGANSKSLMTIAVEFNNNKIGRIRLKIIENASSESLLGFVQETVEDGSEIVTDGWRGYNSLSANGYTHTVAKDESTDNLLPHVHTTISLLKRWLLGTLQGACSKEHLPSYLDEYTFRYNRRTSKSRGLLFLRVLENAVQMETTTYKEIIKCGIIA